MKENINIDTKTFIRFWLVVIGFGLVGLSIYVALPALMIIGMALFLAIALNPSVSKISNLLPSKSRLLSTAIAYVVVLSVLGTLLFLVIPPIIEQTSKFAQNVPSLIDSATTQYSGISDFVDRYDLRPQYNEVVVSLKSNATKFASGIGTNLISGIGSIVSVFANTILVLVLTFLMLVEGPTWINRLWSLYKNKEKMANHRSNVHKMYSVVTGYIAGQLTVSAIDGFFAGLTVFILSLILGVPANLTIPTVAIMFVMSLIPFFGAILGAAFITLVMAINNPLAAIILLIYFVVYQQIENNFIAPRIQSKKLDLSPLIILISIVVGLVLFGIAGGIISIPIAGCIKILVDNYFVRSKAKETTDIKSVI